MNGTFCTIAMKATSRGKPIELGDGDRAFGRAGSALSRRESRAVDNWARCA
jgi:hypothetical protein